MRGGRASSWRHLPSRIVESPRLPWIETRSGPRGLWTRRIAATPQVEYVFATTASLRLLRYYGSSGGDILSARIQRRPGREGNAPMPTSATPEPVIRQIVEAM